MDRFTVPTKYWHSLDDGRVQCDVCPRACKLRDGQRGVCFVRGSAGRRDRAHHVRSVERVLRRPDREEAAQPLPSGIGGLLLRYCGLQPGMPVLPELGHLQVEGDRHARRRGIARSHRPSGCRARLPQRGVHLQRSDDLPGVRHRCRRCLPRGRRRRGGRDRRLHLRPSREPTSTRTSTPPTSTSRASPRTSTGTRAVLSSAPCSTPSSTWPRDRRVVRAHDPPDPRAQRQRRGARRHDDVGGRAPRAGRADALHRVPSRLPHARSVHRRRPPR